MHRHERPIWFILYNVNGIMPWEQPIMFPLLTCHLASVCFSDRVPSPFVFQQWTGLINTQGDWHSSWINHTSIPDNLSSSFPPFHSLYRLNSGQFIPHPHTHSCLKIKVITFRRSCSAPFLAMPLCLRWRVHWVKELCPTRAWNHHQTMPQNAGGCCSNTTQVHFQGLGWSFLPDFIF